MADKDKLTARQELFCKEYLIDLNATQAAKRAGYSEKTAKDIGCQNLAKLNISNRIQELKAIRDESIDIDARYVLSRLKEIDQLDVLDILDDALSAFKPLSQWPKSWRTSISGVDIAAIASGDNIETTIKKIKWPDKVKNLEMIGRHVSVKAWDKEKEDLGGDSMAESIGKLIDRLPN